MNKLYKFENNTTYLTVPLLFMVLGVYFEYSGLDLKMISPFFDAATKTWPYNKHWLSSTVMHKGANKFVQLVGVSLLFTFIASFFVEKVRKYRKPVGYMLLASLLGPILVSIGKATTHIYCPWDLKIFGGTEPYIRLFDTVPKGAKIGHAFPAGHASGGFAFLSLYFLFKEHKPELRFYGLLIGLVMGFSFGFAQQTRGAHFFSHDLFSAAVCFYAAFFVYYLMYERRRGD